MTQKAFKYRFSPTPEQENLLRRTMGCTRLVYNRALAARTEAWYERQERVGYAETSTMLTDWKKQEDLQFLGVEDLSGSNLVKNHKLALASG